MRCFSKLFSALIILAAVLLPAFPMTAGSADSKPKLKPTVISSTKNATSKPVREMAAIRPKSFQAEPREIPYHPLPKGRVPESLAPLTVPLDPVLQDTLGAGTMPGTIVNFEGVDNQDGVLPPDTTGDVSSDHYVQWVNLSFSVFDKEGQKITGPTPGNELWESLGGICANNNHGDPIVLYDHLADRWFMSQFALPYDAGPFYQCIAVSQTSDPTGSWHLYQFKISNNKMNDYPKFGVWPDGYYMSVNQFTGGQYWGGVGVAAFERDKMLNGTPGARMIYFDLGPTHPQFSGMLPSDLDGIEPPAGSPNYFAEVDDSTWVPSYDAMRIWQFHVDWINTGNSTFGKPGSPGTPNNVLQVDNWNPMPMSPTSNLIPQKGASQKLDCIGDRLMYRLQYRYFPGDGRECLVVNHTVNAGSGRAGVRWYEIRSPRTNPVVYQQGTWAPVDSGTPGHRWMGSIAMDGNGNIALGYSYSSTAAYPSIRYTGRLADDPLGQMTMGEAVLMEGTGAQTNSSGRWGDYSTMSVDPLDDCTFWYTQEYYKANPTTNADWHTRVGSFKLADCGSSEPGGLKGRVTDVATSQTISGATVTAGSVSTKTDAQGGYQFLSLNPGTITVTVDACGYQSVTDSAISITSGNTTEKDFSLSPLATTEVCGRITDGSGHGWGIYAKIEISSSHCEMDPVFTDPQTGEYCVTLAQGVTYTFSITAVNGGYEPVSYTGIAGSQADFQMQVDTADCSAPGYSRAIVPAEQFETVFPPNEWNAVDNSGSSNAWYQSTRNRTTSTGKCAVADSSLTCAESSTYTNTTLRSAAFTLPASGAVSLTYDSYFQDENGTATGTLDISADSGTTWDILSQWTGTRGPTSEVIDLGSYAGKEIRLRWRFTDGAGRCTSLWHIDNVAINGATCGPVTGGLVIGNIFDANKGYGLAGATVTDGKGHAAKSVLSTEDSNVSDGFYSLFMPLGTSTLTASGLNLYATDSHSISLEESSADTVLKLDFSLPAGLVSPDPQSLTVNVAQNETATAGVALDNSGSVSAKFLIKEIKAPSPVLGPFEKPRSVVKPFKQHRMTTEGLKMPPLPAATLLAGRGDTIRSWNSGLKVIYGIAFDPNHDDNSTVWVSSPYSTAKKGADSINEYNVEGKLSGRSYPFTWDRTDGPLDAAFNFNTGTIWILSGDTLNGTDCIYEIDPASGYTGSRICPGGKGFTNFQHGLAYDPTTDTFYAGSWTDRSIHHFASDGTMLDEVNVDLPISGLAYNPDTRHLFVMTNTDTTPSPIYVLDAADNYALLGQFGTAGFNAAYSGAGLEMDCEGHLWAANQVNGMVYEVRSGETTTVCQSSITWLSVDSPSGNLDPGGTKNVAVTFDASVPEITRTGNYTARLMVATDTPYRALYIPVIMKVQANYHTITATAQTGGSISPSGPVQVKDGDDMTFTITPKVGYQIKDVKVDGVSQGKIGSYKFKQVQADHTIVAAFEKKILSITVSAGTGGAITPAGPVQKVVYGTDVTFRIQAKKGYKLSNVVVDGKFKGSIPAFTFFNVTKDHSISAVFSPLTYTITASAGRHGSIKPSGKVKVAYSKAKTFTFRPAYGYKVANVFVDGKPQGASSSYTFKGVAANHTIKVTFVPKRF